MSNRLQYESSPYLLQHAGNPVDWYPWGEEAFERARSEDKPIFLSIGYSTCHWCHVMAHESFEDEAIAELLNRDFISIKVDREERPDIDSIYMAACQAFTGGGGWPTSIFMTADQKPFFAGTYFPPTSQYGRPGLKELLMLIREKWDNDRKSLLLQADQLVGQLNRRTGGRAVRADLPKLAVSAFRRSYDRQYGGFGNAPKFPSPHIFLFLLEYHAQNDAPDCLEMVRHTLLQMYRGGLFDHIGGGFCRYSTDKEFLVPHFEKMLYDNALLIEAYCRTYAATGDVLFLRIAEKTAAYVLRELSSPEGGFYSAQDADSDGEEGKYYLFTPEETVEALGREAGEAFNLHFGIDEMGDLDGKSIPNLLQSNITSREFDGYFEKLQQYRLQRCRLHLDDKILTSWNGLMITAMCTLYRVSGNHVYLNAAKNAETFIREHLCDGERLFVSFRDGKRGVEGFLDDYAGYILALLSLYDAVLDEKYLARAKALCTRVFDAFKDDKDGGYYMNSREGEALIRRPKESYDGAIPSGNSLMAWNLVRLALLTGDEQYEQEAQRQLDYLGSEAAAYPAGYTMFLLAYLLHDSPPPKLTVVSKEHEDVCDLSARVPVDTVLSRQEPSDHSPLRNDKTTFYMCRNRSCLPPVNDLREIFPQTEA